jgi:hypothetical protein
MKGVTMTDRSTKFLLFIIAITLMVLAGEKIYHLSVPVAHAGSNWQCIDYDNMKLGDSASVADMLNRSGAVFVNAGWAGNGGFLCFR